jgi:hypothetical protein
MIGGAGYYAGKKNEQAREQDAYRDQRLERLEQQSAQPTAPEPAGGLTPAAIEQLKQLAELHQQGS